MKRLQGRQDGTIARPECDAGGIILDYNLGLHVAALFIILFVSASACLFALIMSRVPKLRIHPNVLFVVRHFGTGVLLATAFVHLLPTAFISLTAPCLPAFWNETYPAMAGAIALLGIFFLVIVEQIFSPGRHLCLAAVPELTRKEGANEGHSDENRSPGGKVCEGIDGGMEIRAVTSNERLHSHTCHTSGGITSTSNYLKVLNNQQNEEPFDEAIVDKDAQDRRKKALMQCTMLEMGILFHSVFIGMALSVTTGSEQVTLLVAIIFHQTFEGLALGSRIAEVGWKKKAIQPWLMAVLYGCTTPVGQALGIATRNLYSPNSATGLIVVGLFNALSSGFLVFNSLVDLLSEDFLSDMSWRVMKGTRRYVALGLVFAGAFCMSLVGAWA